MIGTGRPTRLAPQRAAAAADSARQPHAEARAACERAAKRRRRLGPHGPARRYAADFADSMRDRAVRRNPREVACWLWLQLVFNLGTA
jgi:hypothetical protein